jgi:hypothetical protein
VGAVTGQEWVAAFASALGLPAPDEETVDRLLALAAEAAHSSERTAAPIACWLVGVAGADPAAALTAAEGISAP